MSFFKSRGDCCCQSRLYMYVSNYLSFTDACPCFTQRIHVTHQSLSTPPTINMHVSPSIPTQLNFNLLCITLYTLMFIFIHSFLPPTTDRPDTGKVTAAGKVGTESSKPCSFSAQRVFGFQLHPDPSNHFVPET